MNRHKFSTAIVTLLTASVPAAHATSVLSSNGSVTYVRAYGDGSGGVRLELGVSTAASHNCGTYPTIYYFDANKLGADTTKSIIAIATAAMMTGTTIGVTYDCSLSSGGYGWGIGITAAN
jgi:hypothetical protein